MGPLLNGIYTAIYTRRSLQFYNFKIFLRVYIYSVVHQEKILLLTKKVVSVMQRHHEKQ